MTFDELIKKIIPYRIKVKQTMSSKSPFRRIESRTAQSCDIESLFKDLKNRSPDIKELFAPQADVLRDYQKSYIKAKDVSIELPTGSGKTLVGLLIAEYRRRILRERILYLCPTKQLAYQVGKKSEEYSIPAKVLVGRRRDFNPIDVSSYRSGKSVAISTYSGLFNSNPEFDDAQTIILDDSHGGEGYISSPWSITINRRDSPNLYQNFLSKFDNDLPSLTILYGSDTHGKSPKVDMIPYAIFFKRIDEIKELFESNLSPDIDPSNYYAWQSIKDSLHACQAYISCDQLLIRPYISPTLTHKPFDNANQRIYMSATLGSGGELERITGINHIERIPTPKIYLKHGIGRRLFLFPDLIKESSEYEPWLVALIGSSQRTLALCPTGKALRNLEQVLQSSNKQLSILEAINVENSIEPFSESKDVVLALTNRYDGIDLPSKKCSLLVMYGLPTGTNLQESFLEDKLGLDVLLRERVKTRIAQGVGRCTRSATDQSLIVMVGKRLLDFCNKRENQLLFNNEIRGELDYVLGLEIKEIDDLNSMIKSFYDKDSDWGVAEEAIAEIRDSNEQPDTKITDILSSCVANEVNFSYDLWFGRFKDAVERGIAITDKLTDPRLSSYRAFWYYLTACAAFAASKENKYYSKIAEKHMSDAISACKTVSWFAGALKSMLPSDKVRSVASELETLAIEGIADTLKELGVAGHGIPRKLGVVGKLLSEKNHSKFDSGMAELGLLLGFNSWKTDAQATPDCIWQLGDEIAYLFEGKSEAKPENAISVDDCRQASGHLKWASVQPELKNCKAVRSILVTPRTIIDKNAVPHANNLYFMTPSDMLSLFGKTKNLITCIRGVMTNEFDEEFKEKILSELVQNDLTPKAIQAFLQNKPIEALKTT
ncbi:MAG: DEAD/DEAH box helicase family protein [Candidatus Bathyarchaeota archaeon]|nr:DEAD/DEAH box helicase family protein [Candidatus Bathyarchaeota archaeon]